MQLEARLINDLYEDTSKSYIALTKPLKYTLQTLHHKCISFYILHCRHICHVLLINMVMFLEHHSAALILLLILNYVKTKVGRTSFCEIAR